MAATLLIPPMRATDANGRPYNGAKWYFYATGTLTPATVYTTAALNVAHSSPVVADSGGKFANIYGDASVLYRAILKNSSGSVTLHDMDPINASELAALAASGGSALVEYHVAGAGYAARTVQAKLRELWVTPEDFRIGAETDTQAMTKWAAALGNGVCGRIDNDYTITAAMQFTGLSDFTIAGNGSVTIASGTSVAYGYQAFLFSGCTRFTLEDIVFDGNRSGRTPAEVDAHTVTFYSCNFYVVRNVTSKNAVCDGFMLESATPATKSTHNHDFLFENCTATNCYRQGMTIAEGYNGLIFGGAYNASTGTAPQSGIDLESDAGASTNAIENITIQKVRFEGNVGFGLTVSGSKDPRNIDVIDCDFIDNTAGAVSWGASSGALVRPFISGCTNSMTRGAIDVPSTTTCGNLDIDTPVFRRLTYTGTLSAIYVHASGAGNVTVKNPDVDTCGIFAGMAAAKCSIKGGNIRATTVAGAVQMGGADAVVEGMTIEAFTSGAIYTTAANAVIRNNKCLNPASNDATYGVIRVDGATGRVEGNDIRQTASAAGYGIRSTVALKTLIGNDVFNFTGNGYNLTGTPLVESANMINGAQRGAAVASVTSAAAIAIPSGQRVVTITGTTNITSITTTAEEAGRVVTLIFAGILTFTDGSNLKLAGNLVTTADDTITLVCDGTNWIEIGRSVN